MLNLLFTSGQNTAFFCKIDLFGGTMKKITTLGAIFALSLSALSFSDMAEAKRGFSSPVRSVPAVRKPTTQKKQQQAQQQKNQNQQQKADADFSNTPPRQTMPNSAAQSQAQGSRIANFATGAMAGYLLSDMLSPNEALAQPQPENQAEPMQQLTEQVKQTPAMAEVPTFKAIEPQNDPFLIEKTSGYLRYCLNGVQYLISTANTQLPPTLMVDRNNAPAQCAIVQ